MNCPRRKFQTYILLPLDCCPVGSARSHGLHLRVPTRPLLDGKAMIVVLSSSARVYDRTTAGQMFVTT